MKKSYIALAVLVALTSLTACVKDLNTEPIDPNVLQKFDQDRVYYKIYAGLGTSGQKGPDGNCDIVANDEGYSVFYRLIFVHNEFPTDCGWWIWNDAGVTDLNEMNWTSENSFTKLLYNRLTFNVTTCNHFLDNTSDNNDKSRRQRAEIRFMRALNYYYLLDFFGNPPFTMTVSSDSPRQIEGGRPALYQWLVDELTAAEDYLEENTEVYRVNRNAARLLLARLYLNAPVYTNGQVQAYDKAKEYAQKVMNNGKYHLTEHYAQMFMGDNDNNQGSCEVIFAIPQDGDYIQSWGASSCLVCMTRATGMLDYGSDDKWECYRATPEMVKVFTDHPENYKANEFEMPALLGDDRAMLCNQAKALRENPDSITWAATCEGGAKYGTGNFQKGWAMCKWTGRYSTATDIYEPNRGKHKNFIDTDVPLLRVAEAYMTYAEALYRQGDEAGALSTINDLRATRHAAPLETINEDVLLDEWLREFYCEGHRRIDLIRFGQFCGENSTKEWEGHKAGKDGKYIVYPIPNSDIIANPNLKQNEGY